MPLYVIAVAPAHLVVTTDPDECNCQLHVSLGNGLTELGRIVTCELTAWEGYSVEIGLAPSEFTVHFPAGEGTLAVERVQGILIRTVNHLYPVQAPTDLPLMRADFEIRMVT